jgi:hypothetical protein
MIETNIIVDSLSSNVIQFKTDEREALKKQ